MIRKLLFWFLLAAMSGLWAYSDRLFPAELIKASAANVSDGDTLTIGDKVFRLYGVDAPEYHQTCTDARGAPWPCGKEARLQLAAYVASGGIVCAPRAEDRYNRLVATCASASTPDLSAAMAEAGLAISPAARGRAAYAQQEENARAAKRGLWQGRFDLPSDWRTAHPRSIPVSKS